jgi:hypothetical protein
VPPNGRLQRGSTAPAGLLVATTGSVGSRPSPQAVSGGGPRQDNSWVSISQRQRQLQGLDFAATGIKLNDAKVNSMTSVQVSLSLVLVAYEGEAREGKFMGPGETAVVGSEGPIQRTREGGVNGSR